MNVPGLVVAALGDRHNGMQTCRIVEGETPYIYKPRNASTETAYEAFLRALGSAGLSYLPGHVQVVRCESDWHTELPVEHCATDRAGIVRYYRRAGTLLFLAYLLGASDLHAENIIACGEYPVLVDLETLLGAPTARSTVREEDSLTFSVLRSHLLPFFLPGKNGPVDQGGFSGVTGGGKNLPLLGTAPQPVCAYLPQLTWGFRNAYRFAAANVALVDRLLGLFDRCRIRQMLRPTASYAKFLELIAAAEPSQQQSVAQALVLRAYTRDSDTQRVTKAAAAIRAEAQSLLAGDVPLFFTYANECDLRDEHGIVLPNHLALPAIACARKRLSQLCRQDMEKQLALLQQVYGATLPAHPCAASDNSPCAASDDRMQVIASELKRWRIASLQSRYLKLGYDSVGRVFWQSAGFDLYDGLTGIGCFYAACYAKTGDKKWTRCLTQLLQPFEAWLHSQTFTSKLTNTACALSGGLAGMLAALLHMSELTGQLHYTDLALQLARHLTPTQDAPLSADVLSGAAGLALCLPKLPREISLPLASALEQALAAAQPKLTGAAHGAAGLALALGALQTVACDEHLNDKILELLLWEDTFFDEETQNWFDLREPARRGFMSGWCSGAPGIGMTRKKLLRYTTDARIIQLCREDIARATQFLQRETHAKRATLCCGLAARVMAASYLGICLPDSVHKLSCVTDARCEGLYHVLGTADANVGLMQGLAGVGYALALAGDERCGGLLL